MNNRFTSSPRYSRFNIGRFFNPLFLGLAVFAMPFTLSAQQRVITTLLPSEVMTEPVGSDGWEVSPESSLRLKFQMDSLPPGAKVTSAHLLLVGKMKASQTITVSMNDGKVVFGEKTPLEREEFSPDKRADWEAAQQFLDALKNSPTAPFSLVLKTDTTGGASNWDWRLFSEKEKKAESKAESNVSPRLILEYTVPNRPAVVQTAGVPAMHSSDPFLPSPAGGQFISQDVVSADIWSFAPVFYKNRVYLVTGKDPSFQLQALPPLGGTTARLAPVTLGVKPGKHLVMSESGRLYIVGSDRILAYDLEKDPAAEVKTLVGDRPLSPKSMADLKPTRAPAVGPDGSLYYVNLGAVYGLNPNLQELWKVTLDGATETSRVTVGPSGRFVYLTVKGKGLVAINAQTGEELPISTESGNSQKPLAVDENITFHAPVVIQYPEGREKIYAAANMKGNGVLAAFDNNDRTITAAWKEPLPGLWSQPRVDLLPLGSKAVPNQDKKLYAVRVEKGGDGKFLGTLTAINWLPEFNDKKEAIAVTAVLAPAFAVPADSEMLSVANSGGNIAIDKAGNVLIWNGGPTSVKLYAFSPPAGPVLELPSPVSPAPGAFKIQSRLLFGSDGTLYAADPANANNRQLRAIVPQYTLDSDSVAAIDSPTHLWVDGTVGQNTTLSAGGSVFLGRGFTVKQGGTLKISSGVSQ